MTSGRECDQFRGVLTKAVDGRQRLAASPAVIDPHVATDAPAQFLKALLERGDAGLSFLIVRSEVHLNPDPARAPTLLLCARRERPSRYTAAEKCDEFPPPHGAYRKAKDHRLTIAGNAVHRSKKRPLMGELGHELKGSWRNHVIRLWSESDQMVPSFGP
jgi:hypothetical protein